MNQHLLRIPLPTVEPHQPLTNLLPAQTGHGSPSAQTNPRAPPLPTPPQHKGAPAPSDDSEQQLVMWTAEPGSPSHDGLRILASWSTGATGSGAPAAEVAAPSSD
ncbi:hypothetical protein GCM10009603_52460 [Nocardiopsis exhalans]